MFKANGSESHFDGNHDTEQPVSGNIFKMYLTYNSPNVGII